MWIELKYKIGSQEVALKTSCSAMFFKNKKLKFVYNNLGGYQRTVKYLKSLGIDDFNHYCGRPQSFIELDADKIIDLLTRNI